MKAKERPQLLINTSPLENEELAKQVFLETDKYSITPTTFKSRSLKTKTDLYKLADKTKLDIGELQQKLLLVDQEANQIKTSLSKLKDVGIISEGELKGCEVQIKDPLFGLLATKQNEFKNQQNTLELYFKSIVITDEIGQKQALSYEDNYLNNQGNFVTRYGINITKELSGIVKEYNSSLELLNPKVILEDQSVSSSKKKGTKSNQSNKEDQPNITLHPLEVINLQNAIDYLNLKEESKTVLIDIFARESQIGMVKWQEDNPLLPETHTVVLFKNSEKQLVVIDPSNSSFSKHLSTNTKMLISDDIEILVPQKEIKIYEQDKKIGTGSEPDKYRDCIDIAVKIAFGLSKIKKVDPNKVEFLEIIQEVTNQKNINENILLPKEAFTRIKQASDSDIRESFNELSIYINKQLKSFSTHPKKGATELAEKIQEKYIEKLYGLSDLQNDQYNLGIQALGELRHNNDQAFKIFINE